MSSTVRPRCPVAGRDTGGDGRELMTTGLRVAAVPVEIEIGDLAGNLARIGDALGGFDAAGPQLLVLPELATSGYVFIDAAEARSLALRADDDRLTALASHVPGGAVAVVGFCEADGDHLYNSAVVLSVDGILGCYRKAHLWATEYDIFTPGPEAGMVIDTPVCRLGVAICYDSEFPELPRRLALRGAEVLALPVNWPLVPRPDNEHAPEIIQAMAAARSSRLPMVIADRHGTERGVEWTAGTVVISADGWICARSEKPSANASAVLAPAADKTLGEFNDLFADRRPGLYADLVAPQSPAQPTPKRGTHVQ